MTLEERQVLKLLVELVTLLLATHPTLALTYTQGRETLFDAADKVPGLTDVETEYT